jgi:hypothetical protein
MPKHLLTLPAAALLVVATVGSAGVAPTGAAWAGEPSGGDLARIERKIAKEPTYAGKPSYCLLVFGAERKTRVWVVRDGNTVYVDRNGNGDLTEANEKVTGTTETDDSDDFKVVTTEFDLGDLAAIDGKTPYKGLWLRRYAIAPKQPGVPPTDATQLAVEIRETHSQSAGPKFAEKAADAPIAHLDGPLEIRMAPRADGKPLEYERETDGHAYTFQIGTLGLGEGTWAPIGYDEIPDDVHPVAEMTFPAAKKDAPPIVVKFTLDDRC